MVMKMNENNRQSKNNARAFTQPKFLAIMACVYFVIISGCDYLSEILAKNTGHVVNPHIVAPLIIAVVTYFTCKAVSAKHA